MLYKQKRNAFKIGFNQHKIHAVSETTTWRRSNFMCTAAEHHT